MTRRHIVFIILMNALISLAITLVVNWAIERRRPDPEELAALYTPQPQAILASTRVPDRAAPLRTPDLTAQTPSTDALASSDASSNSEPQGVPQGVPQGDIYIVQNGDILSTIASKFNTTVEAIMQANGLDNPDFVFVGQQLRLPPGVRNPEATSAANSAPTATPAPIVGVEIAGVTGAGDLATENILIVNEGTDPVNLQDWSLRSAGGTQYRFGNVPLFAGSSVRLHSRSGEDNSVDLYWGQAAPVWQSGSTVQLLDGQGSLVVSYSIQ